MKKHLIKILTTLLAVTAMATATHAAPKAKPDVLFIAIDDMNDWTTLFDKKNPIKTPHLERLASMGMKFTQGYCSAPGCGPSRASLLTGYSPTTLKIYRNEDKWFEEKPEAVTLPDYFRKNGYVTKGAGKIEHHAWAGGDDPRNHKKYGSGGYSWDEFMKMKRGFRPKKNLNGFHDPATEMSKGYNDWGTVEDISQMTDENTLKKVESYMDEPSEKPRFIAAGIYKPHLPFYAPKDVFERYPMEDLVMPEMPENDLDDIPPAGIKMRTQLPKYTETVGKPASDPGSLKRKVQCYQASADYADGVIGRLLDKLESAGRLDKTIIVLWADHGYHLGDKKVAVKFTLWEKANRVPYIIVAPGITKPGSVCQTPVSLLDLYPTLLDLCGLPPNAENEGQSLLPLLKNPTEDLDRLGVINNWGKGNFAVRSKRWRYIRYADGSEELYDHSKDPWEHTNLAKNTEYQSIIDEHYNFLVSQRELQ